MRLLISGFPRSGTTIIGRILAGIDGAHYLHEPFNTNFPAPGSGFRAPFSLFRIDPSVSQGQAALRRFRRLIEGKRSLAPIRRRDFRNPSGLLRRVIGSVGTTPWRDPSQTLILKDPTAFFSADVLVREFDFIPVVMLRDPVEVAGSFLARGWKPNKDPVLAQESVQVHVDDSLRRHIDDLSCLEGAEQTVASTATLWALGHRILLDHRDDYGAGVLAWHADMVADPSAAITRIMSTLDMQVPEKCHELIDRYCTVTKPSDQGEVPAVLDVRRERGSIGNRARQVMSERYRQLVMGICGDILQEMEEATSAA